MRLTDDDSISRTSTNNARCIAAYGSVVHVVWHDYRFGGPQIFYKRSIDWGNTWHGDDRLTSSSGFPVDPSIAVWGYTVHVVWQDNYAGNSEIYYKCSTDHGMSWEGDIRLTHYEGISGWPSIAVSNNDIHVTWYDFRDGHPEIYYKHSTNSGITWSLDKRLTNSYGASTKPCIGVSDSTVHVAWTYSRDSISVIHYKHSTNNGITWSADTCLTDVTDIARYPSIAVSDNIVHLVWQDETDYNTEIFYMQSTDAGVTWGAAIRLTYTVDDSRTASIAADSNNVHIVWSDYRNGNYEIYYKRSLDNGTYWENDERLTNQIEMSYHPSVATSGEYVHVVWTDLQDDNEEIYYRNNPKGSIGATSEAILMHLHEYVPIPNPFRLFTTVPGREREIYRVYDIAGKFMNTCTSDCIGNTLKEGVYFLFPEKYSTVPIKIIKVR
ncbi:MAG: exo-alpha-sialidase [candidate division WOR-3 bacterium]|nr:MAG: exo-alpha-sialidase [candidate division WOR-3 bacterium]